MLTLVIATTFIALLFDFLNGMNDAANSIATVVSTRVLSPRLAVAWAAFFNFAAVGMGLFFGFKVAGMIGKGIVDADQVNATFVLTTLDTCTRLSRIMLQELTGIDAKTVAHRVLTTLIVLVDEYGFGFTAFSLLANLVLAWALFRNADEITRIFGRNGLRALSKVASLLLAAIAVKFIREGMLTIFGLPGF